MENVPYGPEMRPPTPDALRDRLRAAATADLAVFRQMERWPRTAVALTLKVELGDVPGYSFQHQQFQEWYASHDVERLTAQAVGDTAARDRLKAEILNQRQWEEAVLFAVERSARRYRHEGRVQCGYPRGL
jgi:hypothetical protein